MDPKPNPTPQKPRPRTKSRFLHPVRAFFSTVVFFLKVFPMLPSRPIDWVTKKPTIEKVRYPTCDGFAEGEIYRPPGPGPHPGIIVCLGVVPFTVDHPQVPVLGKALARAGFTALLYWSPLMRDFRLDPIDVENIALAYQWFIAQPIIDPARSGLLGTCVGGSFALMASASPLIRDRIGFVTAYAPFSSMRTLAPDIASASRTMGDQHEPWKVDQLTRHVFIKSLAASLEEPESEAFRSTFKEGLGILDKSNLSADGQKIYALLAASSFSEAAASLEHLPAPYLERFIAMSPLEYVNNIKAPLIVLLHDRGDQVVPVGESQRLVAALAGRENVHYTEMQFSHLDPSKGKLPFFKLVREFIKFFKAVMPIFHQAVD